MMHEISYSSIKYSGIRFVVDCKGNTFIPLLKNANEIIITAENAHLLYSDIIKSSYYIETQYLLNGHNNANLTRNILTSNGNSFVIADEYLEHYKKIINAGMLFNSHLTYECLYKDIFDHNKIFVINNQTFIDHIVTIEPTIVPHSIYDKRMKIYFDCLIEYLEIPLEDYEKLIEQIDFDYKIKLIEKESET